MDKQELIENFGSFFELEKSEQSIAFKIFTGKLKSILGPNDALRIPDFGIFQLKKEPSPRAERGEGFPDHSTAQSLVFSPPLEDLSSRSKALFQTIEINDPDKENESFNEKVFSLGYDQPLIPVGGSAADGAALGMTERELEEKIEAVIAKSELLRNFDLWTDYLGENLEENPEVETIKENALGISEESIETELEIDQAENEEIDTTEKGAAENDDVDWDWSDELHNAIEGEKKESPEDEVELVVEDPFESIGTSDFIDEEESQPEPESEIQEDFDEPVIDDDIPIEEAQSSEHADDIPKEEPEPVEEKTQRDSPVSGNTEIAPMFDHSRGTEIPQEPEQSEKKSYSKYVWVAAGLALILVIYFGYFSNDSNLDIPGEDGSALVDSGQNGETISAVPLDSAGQVQDEQQKTIVPEKVNDSKQKNDAKNRANNRKPEPKSPAVSKSVGNLVYFDGNNYSIQVASYPTLESAQKRVNRLKAAGYDAFIVDAFIEKYGSTWHRVRVGGFASKEEAQNFKLN